MHRLVVFFVLCLTVAGEAWAQGAVVLEGGGVHVEEAAAWMAARTADKRILVLDYADDSSSAPRDWLLGGGFTTVDYLAITSRADADAAYDAITSYSAVYLPGGDQSRYLEQWQGTRTEDALEAVFAAGGTLAGSSAGTAILSGVYFSASQGTVFARESLLDVRHPRITLGDEFLGVLPGLLVDTHFYERGRLARLLALLQRYREDNENAPDFTMPLGVGIDDHTAFVIDPDGVGEVFGSGVVAVLDASRAHIKDYEETGALALVGGALIQLAEGYRYSLGEREITMRPDYATMLAEYIGGDGGSGLRTGVLVLDATQNSEEWGQNEALGDWAERGDLSSSDVICVLTRAGVDLSALDAGLLARGLTASRIDLDGQNQRDQSTAEAVRVCTALVSAIDDLALASAALGPADDNVLRPVLMREFDAVLLLGDDVALVSSALLLGAEGANDAAYRGRLTLLPGIDLFYIRRDVSARPFVVGGIYPADAPASAYTAHENHLAGGLWAYAQTASTTFLAMPDGAALSLFYPSTKRAIPSVAVSITEVPVLAFDRVATGAALPVRHAPTGGDRPRQNAAFDGLLVRSLAKGSHTLVWDSASEPAGATEQLSLRAYPNPSADAVTLALEGLPLGRAEVAVYDLLGRRVLRAHAHVTGGATTLELTWPDAAPSGVYLARVETGPHVLSKRLVRVR